MPVSDSFLSIIEQLWISSEGLELMWLYYLNFSFLAIAIKICHQIDVKLASVDIAHKLDILFILQLLSVDHDNLSELFDNYVYF